MTYIGDGDYNYFHVYLDLPDYKPLWAELGSFVMDTPKVCLCSDKSTWKSLLIPRFWAVAEVPFMQDRIYNVKLLAKRLGLLVDFLGEEGKEKTKLYWPFLWAWGQGEELCWNLLPWKSVKWGYYSYWIDHNPNLLTTQRWVGPLQRTRKWCASTQGRSGVPGWHLCYLSFSVLSLHLPLFHDLHCIYFLY